MCLLGDHSLFCCMFVLIVISEGFVLVLFFKAEDGILDLVRSLGLGDVYKRQGVRA